MPSRTIRPTEAPEPAPFPYTVAAPEGFTPEAVFVSWDGSGAGGDFLPCVSYYSAEGVLLDRAFPTTGAVTAGDSADVGYRPFERGGGAAPAPIAVTKYEAIIDGTGVLVAPNVNTSLPWFKDFGDSLLGNIGGAHPTIVTAGTYAITVYVAGGVALASYDLDAAFRVPNAGPTFQSFGQTVRWVSGLSSGSGPIIAVTRPLAAGDVLEVVVKHNSSGNVRLFLTGAVALLP